MLVCAAPSTPFPSRKANLPWLLSEVSLVLSIVTDEVKCGRAHTVILDSRPNTAQHSGPCSANRTVQLEGTAFSPFINCCFLSSASFKHQIWR
jgi:hypothetical protein